MVRLIHHFTNAAEVRLGCSVSLYFSYETLVAVRNGNRRVRTDTFHSKTTSKHLRTMGVDLFEQVSESNLIAEAAKAFTDAQELTTQTGE